MARSVSSHAGVTALLVLAGCSGCLVVTTEGDPPIVPTKYTCDVVDTCAGVKTWSQESWCAAENIEPTVEETHLWVLLYKSDGKCPDAKSVATCTTQHVPCTLASRGRAAPPARTASGTMTDAPRRGPIILVGAGVDCGQMRHRPRHVSRGPVKAGLG